MDSSSDLHSPGYMPLRLTTAFRTTAASHPNAKAMVFGETERSYRQTLHRINKIANIADENWSIKRGDIVALIAPNRPEYIELVFALSDVGAIVATLNPHMTPAEMRVIFDDCQPDFVIVDPALEEMTVVVQDMGLPSQLLDAGFDILLEQAIDQFTPQAYSEHDSFCICYTSGTTGRPKGVLISHRSRALTTQAMAIEYGCYGLNDRFLAMAPFCHGAGFVFAMAAISFGGTCIIFDNNDPGAIIDRLGQGDVSGVFLVPTHFNRLYQLPKRQLAGIKSAHRLRTIISNAAALAPTLKEQTVAYFGTGLLHETYGSTEAGIVTNIRPNDILRHPESVGQPFLNTVIEIRNEDGQLCAPGEIGELYSRAPYTFNGYLNRPEETAQTICEGWVSVQDLAKCNDQGFITICGRKKDMIVSGGVNIYPAEIENVIGKNPAVKEVAVVGLPDPEWGERLHAFVVSNEGQSSDEMSIEASCRNALAGYKVPRGYTFISELPKNVAGKILKRELREYLGS